MVVCLYYPDSDYLSAIEQACLTTGLITCRIRLFSDESLWRAALLEEGFSGIAAAPRASLEGLESNRNIKSLVLTEHAAHEVGTLSVYEPIDAFNRAILRQFGTVKAQNDPAGLHCVFSFQSCQQQSQGFEALKQQLRRQIPSAALLDFTTLSNVSGKDNKALSDWLWEGEGAVIREGGCYSLCHTPKDAASISFPDWQDKLLNAVECMSHPMWLWCGSEWKELLLRLMPLVKSVSWICDCPKEIDMAMNWNGLIRSHQAGIGAYLISNKGSRQPSAIHFEGAFDGHFESLDEGINHITSGGRQ